MMRQRRRDVTGRSRFTRERWYQDGLGFFVDRETRALKIIVAGQGFFVQKFGGSCEICEEE
jgi:hypothetical protein